MKIGNTEFREAPPTKLRKDRAVADHEMEPCVGNPKMPHRGHPAQVALRGFDDQWRCPACHKIHVALIYRESGETDPESYSAQSVVPTSKEVIAKNRAVTDRLRDAVLPGGSLYDAPLVREQGFLVNPDNVREARYLMNQTPQGYGETNEQHGDRVAKAYRRLKRSRSKK